MKLISIAAALALALSAGVAAGKLPPLSDEAKAKADETRAKAAHTEKVGAFQLCQSMNKTAAGYYAAAKKTGKETKPPVDTPACSDPGAFVYAPPAAPAPKPPSSSEAHSPPQAATTAPVAQQPPAAPTGTKKP